MILRVNLSMSTRKAEYFSIIENSIYQNYIYEKCLHTDIIIKRSFRLYYVLVRTHFAAYLLSCKYFFIISYDNNRLTQSHSHFTHNHFNYADCHGQNISMKLQKDTTLLVISFRMMWNLPWTQNTCSRDDQSGWIFIEVESFWRICINQTRKSSNKTSEISRFNWIYIALCNILKQFVFS